MGHVQRSATDEDSGGAMLFLLRARLLHHQQPERRLRGGGEGPEHAPCGRSTWRRRSRVGSASSIQLVVDGEHGHGSFSAFSIKCRANLKVLCATFGLIQDFYVGNSLIYCP